MSMALTAPTWTLGELLWKARKDADLEQADVAKDLGVSRALVSRWERDLSEPSFRQVVKLAQLTSAEWLVSALSELSGSRWNPDLAAHDVRYGYGDLHPADLLAPEFSEYDEPATVTALREKNPRP